MRRLRGITTLRQMHRGNVPFRVAFHTIYICERSVLRVKRRKKEPVDLIGGIKCDILP